MAIDAMLCMRCNFATRLERYMGKTGSGETPAAIGIASRTRWKEKSVSRSTDRPSITSKGKDRLAGAFLVIVFLALFLLARSNPNLTFLFHGWLSLISFVLCVSLLVAVFGERTDQGSVSLYLPFCALHFSVHVRQNTALLKWGLGTTLLAAVLAGVLSAGL